MPAEKKRAFSARYIFFFMAVLSLVCAFILSLLAQVLKAPQQEAKKLYRSRQLLLAARILSYEGSFILGDTFARYDPTRNMLVPTTGPVPATDRAILALFQHRIHARLVDDQGTLFTFQQAGLDQRDYIATHATTGYATLPYKLIYLILPNQPQAKLSNEPTPSGYVIPINGYGLWDAIYGYLGLSANQATILGMTWYDQKETPGLGGEIGLPDWQRQFQGKKIFQQEPAAPFNPTRAPLGIQIIRGGVHNANLTPQQAETAVDGIAGASITMTGVSNALKNCLQPYRPFLIKVYTERAPTIGNLAPASAPSYLSAQPAPGRNRRSLS